MRIAMAALLLGSCTWATRVDLHSQDCETDLDCSAGRVCSANNFCLLTSKARECERTDQCGASELCTSGMCELAETARWGCVGDAPEAPMPGSGKVTLRMQLVMRAAGETVPLTGAVTAVACAQSTCDEMEGPFTPDPAGMLKVVVEQGFEGFVKFTGGGFVNTFYRLQAPLNADLSAAAEVMILRTADVSKIAQTAGAKVNLTERGVVLFQLLDCLGEPSGDVSITNLAQDPEIDIVYLTADQTAASAARATSAAGVAMVLDAPIGSPKFKLTRQSASTDIGSLAVETVAGAITYVPYQFGR